MKRSHTLEEHVEMGQLIKDACNAVRAVRKYGEEHNMLKAKDVDRLIKQEYAPALTGIRSRLDDEMFHDHPYLTNDAFNVYYHDDDVVTVDELLEAVHKVRF